MPSRQNPSPRFQELSRVYAHIHVGGLAQNDEEAGLGLFAGNSLLPFVEEIRTLIQATGSRTVLDYGCGKAGIHKAKTLVLPNGASSGPLHDYWGGVKVALYDPGVAEYSKLPQGHFDGVISTDVLEHIPEEDIPWVLREFFDYADRFVFANIASYPAKKILPNGWNAHVTVKDASWWRLQIEAAAQGWRGQAYRFVVSEKRSGLSHLLAKARGIERMKRTAINWNA
jgi:hypothetical protein